MLTSAVAAPALVQMGVETGAGPLSVLERLWLLAAALMLVVPGTFTDIIGLGLVAGFYALQRHREVERAHLQSVA